METLLKGDAGTPLNDFKLSDLFESFDGPEIASFIFDDVTLSLDGTGVNFAGKLRMDGPLTPFKEYLASGESIMLTAKIPNNTKSLKEKIKPTDFSLSAQTPFFKQVFPGVSLTQAFLQLDIRKKDDKWNIIPKLTGEFDVDGLTDQNSGSLQLEVSENNKTLTLDAKAKSLKGVFGIHSLTLENLNIKGTLSSSTSSLNLSAKLTVGSSNFEFSGEVTADYLGVIASADTFALKDLSSIFVEVSPSGLQLPEFDVQFNNSSLSLATADCEVNGSNLKKGLSLLSDVKVYEYSFQTHAQISSSGVVFNGELGDLKFGPVDLKKTDVDFQFYKKSLQKPAKFMIRGQANIEGLNLDCGVYFEKSTTTTTVLYAIIDATDFHLGQVFPPVNGTFVNDLSFSKLGFVYASAATQTKNEGFDFNVQKGLQLMGTLNEIPALSDLTGEKHVGLIFSAHFGNPTDIAIAIPDTRLNLGHSVTTDPIQIQINFSPVPALMVIFGMEVKVPNQDTPLHFDMSLSLDELEAKGAVTMKGYWKHPFGVDGIKIGPAVALQLGIIYEQFVETGIPSEFGIAGGLEIAETTVDMAVSISENPMEEILYGKLDEMNPSQLINFASQIIDLKIPKAPDFFELKKLELYCAPAGGMIGTIAYQPGFSFSGDLVIAGEELALYCRVSDSGIQGSGLISGFTAGPLQVRGENGKDATASLELSTGKQALSIDGYFAFLGIDAGIYLSVSDHGIDFHFEQHFLDKFSFEIKGQSSGQISKPSDLDFQLSGSMENDILNYLKTNVAAQIQQTISDTDSKIDSAIKKVDQAQQAYDQVFNKANSDLQAAKEKADQKLAQLTSDLKAAQVDWKGKIDQAQSDVNIAKQKYNTALNNAQTKVSQAEQSYNHAIADAQNKLNHAQEVYNKGVDDAQRKLSAAKNAYDHAFNSAENKLESLKKKLKKLDHWYSKPAYETAKLALEAAKKVLEGIQHGSEYTAWQSAQKALGAAKTGANYTAFQAANKALTLAKTGAEYTAWQTAKSALAAVQYGAEYTAWQTAQKALATVQSEGSSAIATAQQALDKIGETSAYVALAAAQKVLNAVQTGTEATAMEAAKASLTAAKVGAEDILKISQYISSHAGDLINITSFTFSGSLKALENGKLFDAEIKATILEHPYDWKLDYNVKDVKSLLHDLYIMAFDKLKSVVGV